MTELSESDVFRFCRDIAEQPFHECVDTGNVDLDDDTPLKIIAIYNTVMNSSDMYPKGKMVAFSDQHDDELLEKYDVPVRERDE